MRAERAVDITSPLPTYESRGAPAPTPLLLREPKTQRALLDSAARASGSPAAATGPASIGVTAETPTSGANLGQSCGGNEPITLQKGNYPSVLQGLLSLQLASRQQRRTLQLFKDRGLASWGDLSYCPDGLSRRWLPAHVFQELITFPTDTPGACPPHLHLPSRPGQFWLHKGTATDRGGTYHILAPPTSMFPH